MMNVAYHKNRKVVSIAQVWLGVPYFWFGVESDGDGTCFLETSMNVNTK